MPRSAPLAHPPAALAQEGSGSGNIASLNSDGAKNWFIPPYVVPGVILALVAAYAVYRI